MCLAAHRLVPTGQTLAADEVARLCLTKVVERTKLAIGAAPNDGHKVSAIIKSRKFLRLGGCPFKLRMSDELAEHDLLALGAVQHN